MGVFYSQGTHPPTTYPHTHAATMITTHTLPSGLPLPAPPQPLTRTIALRTGSTRPRRTPPRPSTRWSSTPSSGSRCSVVPRLFQIQLIFLLGGLRHCHLAPGAWARKKERWKGKKIIMGQARRSEKGNQERARKAHAHATPTNTTTTTTHTKTYAGR